LVTAAVFGFKFSLMISVGSEAQQNVINPKFILSRFEDRSKGREITWNFISLCGHHMLVVIGCGCKISSQTVLDQRPGTFTGSSKIEDSGSEASDPAKFGHGQILPDNLAHSS
jgi:hypothetical protein